METRKLLLTALAAMGMTASTSAESIMDFNVVTRGDFFAPSSDVQGRLAVGGNASISYYSVGDQLSGFDTARPDTMIVGGEVSYTSGRIYYGNLAYGSLAFPLQASASVDGVAYNHNGSPAIDFAAATLEMETLSQSYTSLATNGNTLFQWGGMTLTGSDAALNVFGVDGSQLLSAHTLNINAPSGSTAVVNVSGATSGLTNMGIFLTGVSHQHVMFNFIDATNLAFGGIDVRGSVIAPYADLAFSTGQMNGQLFVNSFNGAGQINHVNYQGHLPPIGDASTAIPAPSAALAGIALLGLCAARRPR